MARTPDVTVVGLIYRSPPHLSIMTLEMMAVRASYPNVTDAIIVGNHPSPEIETMLNSIQSLKTFIFRRPEPDWYLADVYRAWNFGVLQAKTELVLLMNSDMIGAKDWAGVLMSEWKPGRAVVSRLVEPQKGHPINLVRNFGAFPNVDLEGFSKYARKVRQEGTVPGGLFSPMLIEREHFLEWGGFPEGNVDISNKITVNEPAHSGKGIVGGDKFHIKRIGAEHVTALDSIVYHEWEGESKWKP
ncbi:MAG: glycosyltransferase family 2 protein [Planctomycetota bacterium]|jgi:hypothetical protein